MPDPFQLPRHHREWLGEASRELRLHPTDSEDRLWQALRNRHVGGARFRRQHRLGPYVVDFYCFTSKLVVEVDGAVHADQREYDAERDEILQQAGYRVLRVTVDEVDNKLAGVLSRIRTLCLPSPDSHEAYD